MNRYTMVVCLASLAFSVLALFGSDGWAKDKKQDCDEPEVVVDVDVEEEVEAREQDEEREREVAREEREREREERQRERDRERDEADREDDEDDEGDEGDEGDEDGGKGGGWGHGGARRARGAQQKKVSVSGPIDLRLSVMTGEIQVVTVPKGKELVVDATDCGIDLQQSGNDVEVEMDFPCNGTVSVKLPAGSSVEIESVNGGVTLRGSYVDVEIEAVNGDVEVEKAREVEIEAVNGEVKVASAERARVEAVQGDVHLTTTGAAPSVAVESVSGDVYWEGVCAKGCQISAETLSGEVTLVFGAKSAFDVKFRSHSGNVKDGVGLKIGKQKTKSKKSKRITYLDGSFGGGGGSIDVETHSGSLELKKK